MRTAISSFLFICMVGLPMIIISLVSPGPFAGRLMAPGLMVMAVGVAMSAYFWMKGKKADRDRDEREVFIFEKAAKFSFLMTVLAVQAAWAYNFSLVGNAGDNLFILVAVLWSSFLAGVVYYSLRT